MMSRPRSPGSPPSVLVGATASRFLVLEAGIPAVIGGVIGWDRRMRSSSAFPRGLGVS
jgi:hypothetical protein